MQCGMGLWPLFSCNIAPIERMFAGGLSLATPPVEEAGDLVENGHVYEMHWKEKSGKWLKWNPGIDIKEGRTSKPDSQEKIDMESVENVSEAVQ